MMDESGTLSSHLGPCAVGHETNLRHLYAVLDRHDDVPAALMAAEGCLVRRFRQLESHAVEIVGRGIEPRQWTPSHPGAAQIADDGFREPNSGLADWLTSEPSVLRQIVQASTSEDPVHLRLFGIYRRWRQAASSRSAPGPDWPCGDRLDAAGLWEPAVIRHALSRSPGKRLPEILGYLRSAAQRATGICDSCVGDATSPRLADVSSLQSPPTITLAAELATIDGVIDHFLERCGMDPTARQHAVARLAKGAALNESLWAQVIAAESLRQRASRNPALDLIVLLQHKARFAKGYHASVKLAGRSLDDWFAEQPFDGAAFLDALAASCWVDRATPARSRILALMDFTGPMFGIFTGAEQLRLRAWLDSLALPAESATPNLALKQAPRVEGDHRSGPCGFSVLPFPGEPADSGAGKSERGRPEFLAPTRCSGRELFNRLLNIERDVGVLPTARRHVEICLASATRGGPHRHTIRYSDQSFCDWIEQKYRQQLQTPRKARPTPLLSRSVYRYGIEQLAPGVLVDGCWLQRVDLLQSDIPEVARRLAAIYADEIGDGIAEHSHPRVYRQLLQSLGIDLPPVDTPEFARYPKFLDSAFDLPVFMLSISLSPHRFLPELLGLNLAIELSGLGTSYSRLARDLEYWGIDARIVRLHQSIDNLASGHAALARDCVRYHLDRVYALGGDPTVQQHWRRVWTGYCALGTVTRRFRWQLVARYGMQAGSRWLRNWFRFRTTQNVRQ